MNIYSLYISTLWIFNFTLRHQKVSSLQMDVLSSFHGHPISVTLRVNFDQTFQIVKIWKMFIKAQFLYFSLTSLWVCFQYISHTLLYLLVTFNFVRKFSLDISRSFFLSTPILAFSRNVPSRMPAINKIIGLP